MIKLIVIVGLILGPTTACAQGIDFGAIREGARKADEDNYLDYQRRQEVELRNAQILELRYERDAQAYLSEIVKNRQYMLSRGYTANQFWTNQYQAILNDQTFQAYPRPLQEKIIIGLRRWRDLLEGGY